jgi:hypothetical protein
MKHKKNISPIVLILFVINMSCVETRRLNNIESKINDIHNEKVNSRLLKLDTISSFEWDELIIASPYENLDRIESYDFSEFPSNATSYDQFLFFGFINKKKGVKWISPIFYEELSGLIPEGRSYSIYSKSECEFKLNRNKE